MSDFKSSERGAKTQDYEGRKISNRSQLACQPKLEY